jgi:RNA-directed DNA polymerase
MGVEQQKTHGTQLDLFALYQEAAASAGSTMHADEERQSPVATREGRALAVKLMERIAELGNLDRAAKAVRANKGRGGIDGMSVADLKSWFAQHWKQLQRELLEGRYKPQLVLGVEIPKSGGGVRQLGIPTVVDRLVQQAILQVLDPLLDPTFSDASFGFRPGRSAHQALRRAQHYVRDEGRSVVVDMDLKKFFDRVNHDILMSRLARRIGDKRLLKIIRRFLEAGMMKHGVCVERYEGTPQGGPLSPLLANLLLDDLDKELERRGHRFCRYADDCNIYVRSKAAGERVLASISSWVEKKLKLRVNRDKSAADHVSRRKFLGYRLLARGRLTIAPQSLKRAKDRIREITRRNRGVAMERVVSELNSFTHGWLTYFRYAEAKGHSQRLDEWIRSKLRCVRFKQLKKRRGAIARFLMKHGVKGDTARCTGSSGKGWWRLAHTPAAHQAMSQQWFDALGLQSLAHRYLLLKGNETAGCDIARPVV